MSLNRCEQYLFDYIQGHREEGQHWRAKVQSISREIRDTHEQSVVLEGDLWTYYLELARSSLEFRSGNPAADLRRTSLRNLAEYLLRMWAPVPARRPAKSPSAS